MAPWVPLGRLLALPADAVTALRTLPAIAAHTQAMEAHTAQLADVVRALDQVALATAALPELREDMARVAQTTAVLAPMDGRMATIEAAMPLLVEVQKDLADMPQTLDRLEATIGRLSTLLDGFLVSLEGLSQNVELLQAAIGPLGRVARRLPGQSKRD